MSSQDQKQLGRFQHRLSIPFRLTVPPRLVPAAIEAELYCQDVCACCAVQRKSILLLLKEDSQAGTILLELFFKDAQGIVHRFGDIFPEMPTNEHLAVSLKRRPDGALFVSSPRFGALSLGKLEDDRLTVTPEEIPQDRLGRAVVCYGQRPYFFVVDDDDNIVGLVEPGLHHCPLVYSDRRLTPTHRAVGVLIFDPVGRVVLQRRSYAVPHLKGRLDVIGGHMASHMDDYGKKALDEVCMEFPIEIQGSENRIKAIGGRHFRVRIVDNWENKRIFYIVLNETETAALDNANATLAQIWSEVFGELEKKGEGTEDHIREKAFNEQGRWDGPVCKGAQAILEQKLHEAGKANKRLLEGAREVEGYRFLDLERAVQACTGDNHLYSPTEDKYADGFYALFDDTKNASGDVADLRTEIEQICEDIRQQNAIPGKAP